MIDTRDDPKHQYLHRDYNSKDSIKWAANYPVSMIVSFQGTTKVRIWDDVPIGSSRSISKTQEREARIVLIEPGKALIFHGLQIHSGCSYQERNVRAHCYGIRGDDQLPAGDVTLVIDDD